jgi:phosphoglycerol geranylgeranyltransferase
MVRGMTNFEIYQTIVSKKLAGIKQLALLIDPDKFTPQTLDCLTQKHQPDFILFGGSITGSSIEAVLKTIKTKTSIPVILYPGSLLQLTNVADAILLLSLISGRNADLLIGNHVLAAPWLKKYSKEIISTGYVLVDGGKTTAVEYISNTKPIPSDKPDIAVATAIAGELLGLKMIYLETGSGAVNHVPLNMISEVSQAINIPLIVGGGIKSAAQMLAVYKAGADIVVIGSAAEKTPSVFIEMLNAKQTFLNSNL